MKWRVIITIELRSQNGSSLRREINKALAKCGITKNRGKNTWEGPDVSAQEAVEQMRIVLGYLANPKSIANPKRANFDHLWVYVDRVKPAAQLNSRQ